jgi:hypothetical protein
MRDFLCALLLGVTTTLAGAAPRRVTVDELQRAIQSRLAAHEGDESLAHYLGDLEMRESLPRSSCDAILSTNHLGPRAAAQVELLADASMFLEPVQAGTASEAEPPASNQQAMMNAAVHFVADTFKRLPNFLATRETRSFDDTPLVVTHSGWAPSRTELHLAGTFEQEVMYRNGREEALRSKATTGVDARQGGSPPGLTSTGEFGPILATVLRDVSKGKIGWDHWETVKMKPAAVFHFEVPASSSHYEVNFCCVRGSEDADNYGGGLGGAASHDSENAYRGKPAYRGTLMIDPASGTILRITVDPALRADGPISRSAVAVEYGPVEIGGATYICPVRSIALSRARIKLGGDLGDRQVLRINEVKFTEYHRFSSTSRILASEH